MCAMLYSDALGGYLFLYYFRSQISQEVVLPLLSMAGELMHQREDLFGIITRKDNEIQDYKDQGAAASRSWYQLYILTSFF